MGCAEPAFHMLQAQWQAHPELRHHKVEVEVYSACDINRQARLMLLNHKADFPMKPGHICGDIGDRFPQQAT